MTEAPERRGVAFDDIDDVVDALRRAGHRVSAPARLVLEALFAADAPISAERIAAGTAGRMPLDLTSVYRNLVRLQRLGVVHHLHAGHGAGLYAFARGGDREYLVCVRCARVTAVAAAELDPIRERLRAGYGFHARFGHFPIHGHCAGCARDADGRH